MPEAAPRANTRSGVTGVAGVLTLMEEFFAADDTCGVVALGDAKEICNCGSGVEGVFSTSPRDDRGGVAMSIPPTESNGKHFANKSNKIKSSNTCDFDIFDVVLIYNKQSATLNDTVQYRGVHSVAAHRKFFWKKGLWS